MDLSLRTAGVSDAEVISAFAIDAYRVAFGHSFSAEDLRSHVDSQLAPKAFVRILARDVVLVAEVSGRLVGFAQFGAADPGTEPRVDAELRRLYVHPACQRQGIGGRVMAAALAHPLLAGARSISLDVWDQNHGAQRFYRRHGFVAVATRKFTVASGAETTPDVVMVRQNDALR